MPVLEAMDCDVPVVTSNSSSLPEVAGEAAILVDPKQPNEIANAIERFLKDEEFKNICLKKGKEQVDKFQWEKTADRFVELLKELEIGK